MYDEETNDKGYTLVVDLHDPEGETKKEGVLAPHDRGFSPRSFLPAIGHVFAVLVSDEVVFSCSICHRQYGPLSVHARCYERSIPAPTLSVEGGHASSLPTMLRINLRSVLASSEFDATLTMEMIDKDEFGTVETFLVLDSVPFDMIPLAFIQVGTPPLVEVTMARKI